MALESAYIAQLNPMEQKILQIAQSHLETSFSLKKSIGFQEWQKTQQAEQKQAEQKQAEQKQAEPRIKTPKKKPVIKIKSIPS